jgi:hypothetical protein
MPPLRIVVLVAGMSRWGNYKMNRRTLVLAIGSVGIGVSSCSSGARPDVPATPVTPQQVEEGAVPAALKVPAGNKLTSSLDGSGVQTYQCAKGAWALLQPAATLSEHGKPVGLHFKGPIWVSTVDGSEVGAAPAPVATVNQDGAVPELLLKANQNQGQGMFSKVTYVQRLQTKGGLAPSGSCIDGTQQAIQYSALYRFWSAAD